MSLGEMAISIEVQTWIDGVNRAIVCRQVDNVSNNVNNIERIDIQGRVQGMLAQMMENFSKMQGSWNRIL